MGKPRKGKKGQRDDIMDSDIEVDLGKLSLADAEKTPAQLAKQKKVKKMPAIKLEEDDNEVVDMDIFGNQKSARGGMSAFALLMEDDDTDQSESDQEPQVEKKVPEPEKETKKNYKKNEKDDGIGAVLAKVEMKTPKKEKKKKRNKQDEDIDAIRNEIDGKTKESVKEKPFDLESSATMKEEQIAAAFRVDEDEFEHKESKQKKKTKKEAATAKAKEQKAERKEEEDQDEKKEGEEEGPTVKTAARKRKEKKEKQKLKKQQQDAQEKQREATSPGKSEDVAVKEEVLMERAAEKPAAEVKKEGTGEEGEESSKSKKKRGRDHRKKKDEEKEEKKKRPNKFALAIQEQQRLQHEAEEKARLAEEEEEKKHDAIRKQKEEKERLEKEKKEKAKMKKLERIKQQKADGTYRTAKQKAADRMNQMKIEDMKAQGIVVPAASAEQVEKPKRVVYANRKKKQTQRQQSTEEQVTSPVVEEAMIPVIEKKEDIGIKDSWDEDDDDDVKDAWDADSEEEEEKKELLKVKQNGERPAPIKKEEAKEERCDLEEEEDCDSEEEGDPQESDRGLTTAKRVRERAPNRIYKHKKEAEDVLNEDELRCPVICVLGHVDTGKTKILDKLRRTNVQDGEAGGITQQIGATNVPREAIEEKTKMCKAFTKQELKLPGLLIIDTPGHESFSNLRTRGSSLCDMAILVVDIMHGLQPQTIESINILKSKKCPFVVALNKIDRLYGWQSNPHSDVENTINKQKQDTKQEFHERTQDIIVQFAKQHLNTVLFYKNKNPKQYISMVPTSAHSGDGMGNLVAHICQLTQTHLARELAFSEELHAMVMEVKTIPGLGTTIDVILVNGRLKESQTIIVPGTERPIVTQIRGLLMPEPMKELRVRGQYIHKKEIKAAQGVKIIAKDLDNALAGLPLLVAYHEDEIPIRKDETKAALEDVLKTIHVQEKGVFVQASTFGSLEALLTFLKDSKIPCCGINIGPVHRKDVMRATAMLEREPQYACILAFNVKVEREAQELADQEGVRIFTAEIIYHLSDQFKAYREQYKKSKQEEFKHVAVFPCKLKVLQRFNDRDPIVCGVRVEAGFIKVGQPLCVPSKEFCNLGIVTSIEVNHKPVEIATKGQEVSIKIENTPGETPKSYDRIFDNTNHRIIRSKISRESIDAVKNYFCDEMTRSDWELMVEMKKVFGIL